MQIIYKADAELLIRLLDRVSNKFPKLLVIADNVHNRGSEALFECFNHFASKESENIIKFLFGAREEEFKTAKEALEREKAAEIDIALRSIHQIRIDFNIEDAALFLKKANAVSKQIDISDQHARIMSEVDYKVSEGDPFMFVLFLMSYLSEEETTLPRDFLYRDLNEKIKSLEEDETLFKAALLSSFMGMFDIPLLADGVLESNRIYRNHLKSLAAKGFLFQNGEYKVRHELWALIFLSYFYDKEFDNDFASFDAMYNIKGMISSILNNIDSNYLLNILTRCAIFYKNELSKPIAKVIIDNYVVPDHLNSSKKAEIYSFGLGNFYSSIKEHTKSLEFYNKAIELDPNNAYAWNNKGYSLNNLGKYNEAIECLDKAIELDPNNVNAWNDKGNALYGLKRYDEAIKCYDKAIELDPNYTFGWNGKGNALYSLSNYKEATACYDKAIETDANNFYALSGKGNALNVQGNYKEAIKCYDKAIELDPNYTFGWSGKGNALSNLGKFEESIICYDKSLAIDPSNVYAWSGKGNALNRLKRYDEAITYYDKVLDIDPNNKYALDNKDLALKKLRYGT